MGSQSPEGMLRDAVDRLELKETFAEQPIDPRDGSVDYYGSGPGNIISAAGKPALSIAWTICQGV